MPSNDSPLELKAGLVGKTLDQVPTPAIVLDLAKVQVNCQRMLDATQRLDIGWRAHIKTHKTAELTGLQVGDDASSPANIVVSTVLEAEKIVPLLKEYQSRGRAVNVLYSFPLYPSCVDRLARVSSDLGPGGLSVMIDHPAQIPLLASLRDKARAGDAAPNTNAGLPLVFLKVDMGYNRAGVIPNSPECDALIEALLVAEDRGHCVLHGLYAHAGQSYETRRDWDAMGLLAAEFLALQNVAAAVRDRRAKHPLVLSVGATPTTTTLQHPAFEEDSDAAAAAAAAAAGGSADEASTPATATTPAGTSPGSAAATIKTVLSSLRADGYGLEVHAGVYPVLDMQQLATHARGPPLLSASDIAITVLAEVASLYPNRTYDGTAQALINAGSLALGREPCKNVGGPEAKAEGTYHYSGWGVVMPWGAASGNPPPGPAFPSVHRGWEVAKVSQEHGVLGWATGGADEARIEQDRVPLQVGSRVRIWPNHACVAGAGFDRYLIVDSRREGKEDEVVDMWPRWNGW